MFERFTKSAIQAIMLAQEEARRMGHSRVGSEQILLGLVREKEGIAAEILASLGVQLSDVRAEVENIIGHGTEAVVQEIPFTPNAKSLLQSASAEAQDLKHDYIGTEHLLIAIARADSGVGVQVLKNLNVDLNTLLTQALSALKKGKPTKGSRHNGKKKKLIAVVVFFTSVALAILAPVIGLLAPNLSRNIVNISFSLTVIFLLIAAVAFGVFLFSPSDATKHIKQLKFFPAPLFRTILLLLLALIVDSIFIANYQVLHHHLMSTLFPLLLTMMSFVILLPMSVVIGNSMSPALESGDSTLGEMITRMLGCPFKRGDIVTFRANREILKFIPQETIQTLDDLSTLPHRSREIYIKKRIIGIPGDRIEITKGSLVLNGLPLTEPWAVGFDYNLVSLSDMGIADYRPFPERHHPIIVPSQSYFVLGDNRNCTNLDSHIFGFVNYESILTRTIIIFWREGKFKLVKLQKSKTDKSAPNSPWNKRQAAKAILGLASFIAIFMWIFFYESSVNQESSCNLQTAKEMWGTWTDPKGQPGNSLQFERTPNRLDTIVVNKLLQIEHLEQPLNRVPREDFVIVRLGSGQASTELKVTAADHDRLTIIRIVPKETAKSSPLILRRTKEPLHPELLQYL
jgi:signal peptidase I